MIWRHHSHPVDRSQGGCNFRLSHLLRNVRIHNGVWVLWNLNRELSTHLRHLNPTGSWRFTSYGRNIVQFSRVTSREQRWEVQTRYQTLFNSQVFNMWIKMCIYMIVAGFVYTRRSHNQQIHRLRTEVTFYVHWRTERNITLSHFCAKPSQDCGVADVQTDNFYCTPDTTFYGEWARHGSKHGHESHAGES